MARFERRSSAHEGLWLTQQGTKAALFRVPLGQDTLP